MDHHIFARVSYKNVSGHCPIQRLKVQITAFDANERPLDEPFEHDYQNLFAYRGETFAQFLNIPFPISNAHSFTVSVREAEFTDDIIWPYSAPEEEPKPAPSLSKGFIPQFATAVKQEVQTIVPEAIRLIAEAKQALPKTSDMAYKQSSEAAATESVKAPSPSSTSAASASCESNHQQPKATPSHHATVRKGSNGNRYERIYTLPNNLYAKGAPVLISAGALLLDYQTGRILVQLKFKNIDSHSGNNN